MDVRLPNAGRKPEKVARRSGELAAERQQRAQARMTLYLIIARQGEVTVLTGACASIECAELGRGSSRGDRDQLRQRR